jgi:hypothetical protein
MILSSWYLRSLGSFQVALLTPYTTGKTELVTWVEATEPDDQSWISETHMVKKTDSHRLSFDLYSCMMACACMVACVPVRAHTKHTQ